MAPTSDLFGPAQSLQGSGLRALLGWKLDRNAVVDARVMAPQKTPDSVGCCHDCRMNGVLVDRTFEVATVLQALGQASTTGTTVTVEGPAGIGKSALLAWAAEEGRARGMTVMTARASQLESTFAFGVVRQMFDPVIRARGVDVLFQGAAEQARDAFDMQATGERTSPDVDLSFAQLHGLYWLTVDVSRDAPVLLVVDDAHWADVPSMRYLAHLQARLDGIPVVMVIGLRTGDRATDPLLLDQVAFDSSATVIRPSDLTLDGTGSLVLRELGIEAEEGFVRGCHEASGGNPLLLHELLRLAQVHTIEPTAIGVDDLMQLAPNALVRRVNMQLARLGEAALAVSRSLAVLGRSNVREVAELAGVSTEVAVKALQQLSDATIVHWSDRLREFAFVHPLIEKTVYESIGLPVRAALHSRAATLLRDAGGNAEAITAHMLYAPPSGDPDAVALLRQVAELEVRRGAPEAALRRLERCLIEPLDPRTKYDVLRRMGEIGLGANVQQAHDCLQAALSLTQVPTETATTMDLLGRTLFYMARFAEATTIRGKAARLASQEDVGVAEQIRATMMVGMSIDPSAQQVLLNEVSAVRAAGRSSERGGRMLSAVLAHHAASRGDNRSEVEDDAHRALDIPRAMEALGPEVWTCAILGLASVDLRAALAHADLEVEQAHSGGSLMMMCQAYSTRTLIRQWCGDISGAVADGREVFRLQRLDRYDAAQAVGAYLASAASLQGKSEEAWAALDTAWPESQVPEVGGWFWVVDARTRVLLDERRFSEALAMAQYCGELCEAVGYKNPAFVPWRSHIALAAFQLGDVSTAQLRAEEELHLARSWGDARSLGRVLRIAGLCRDGSQRRELLEESIQVLSASAARLELAQSTIALGAVLRSEGKRSAAREVLQEAYAHALSGGADMVAAQAAQELRAAGARPRRDAVIGPESLTPSERRVVELAVSGLTNREIAQILFVTVKTVEVHLSNSYRKLGVNSRHKLGRAMSDAESQPV